MDLKDLRHRILIVEDDLSFRKTLERALQSLLPKAEIQTAETATEAMATMTTSIFDLVITDYKLAKNATGLVLWDIASKTFPNTKFLLVSGAPLGELLDAVSGHNHAPAFLPKPFSQNDLKESLERLLGSRP